MTLPQPVTPPPCGPGRPQFVGSLCLVHPEDDDRAGIEAFIARVYARRYGARVGLFAPCLAGLRDPLTGQWVAAAGFRRASEAPLFLERYLDAPVEAVLGRHQDQPVYRHEIVEVGHLAAERVGAGRLLIPFLGRHLASGPTRWVVSTLTQELRHLFVRMGVTPLALANADPGAVGASLADWGSYYDHGPTVLAGRLDAALRQMQRRSAARGASTGKPS